MSGLLERWEIVLGISALLVGAGIWLGSLQAKVSALQSTIEDLKPEAITNAQSEALQAIEDATEDFDKHKAVLRVGPVPVNCPAPAEDFRFDVPENSSFGRDLFTCDLEFAVAGTLYVSLQGHIRNREPGTNCTFSIFLDGTDVNAASRPLPSLTGTETWVPAFMSEAIRVEAGKGRLSVRPVAGKKCAIHDPDINGLFLPGGD